MFKPLERGTIIIVGLIILSALILVVGALKISDEIEDLKAVNIETQATLDETRHKVLQLKEEVGILEKQNLDITTKHKALLEEQEILTNSNIELVEENKSLKTKLGNLVKQLKQLKQQKKVNAQSSRSSNTSRKSQDVGGKVLPKQATNKTTTSKKIATSEPKANNSKELIGIFEATAYTDNAQSQGKWVGQTASGMKPQVGVIAVDPKVIPLGTKLYVEGYGNCVAGDTGGDIKGMRIDLFKNTQSECTSWGRRKVKVYRR